MIVEDGILNSILEVYPDSEFLKADGFDTAILGVEEITSKLIYSVKKCIEVLMEDMTYEEALEYFNFNVYGAYMGEKTPIWCWDNF